MELHAMKHQGFLGITGSGKRQGKILPFSFQREHGPAKTLILDFWPPERNTINFCCFKPPYLGTFVMSVPGN